MQPEADMSEKYVLACILRDESAYWDVVEYLPDPQMFRTPFHRKVYTTMQEIINDGGSPDLPTLGTRIEYTRLLEYQEQFASAGNVVYHCQQVHDAHLRRELQQLFHEAKQWTEEPGGLETMQKVLEALYDLDAADTTDILTMQEVLAEGAEYYFQRKNEGVVGHRTGFHQLDNLTMGVESHDYWVILGGPSSGKTAMAMQMALNMAENGVKIGILPLEGSVAKLGYRFLLNKIATPPRELEDDGRVGALCEKMQWLPIYTRQIRHLTDVTYPAAVQQMKRQHDIDVVIVDYIQLMDGQGQTRNEQLTNISRRIVDMNNLLDISTIILSQPPKSAYEGRLPGMSDTRESGAISQDASKAIGMSPAKKLTDHPLITDLSPEDIMHKTILNLFKNKEGATKALRIHIEPALMKLYDEIHVDTPAF